MKLCCRSKFILFTSSSPFKSHDLGPELVHWFWFWVAVTLLQCFRQKSEDADLELQVDLVQVWNRSECDVLRLLFLSASSSSTLFTSWNWWLVTFCQLVLTMSQWVLWKEEGYISINSCSVGSLQNVWFKQKNVNTDQINVSHKLIHNLFIDLQTIFRIHQWISSVKNFNCPKS